MHWQHIHMHTHVGTQTGAHTQLCSCYTLQWFTWQQLAFRTWITPWVKLLTKDLLSPCRRIFPHKCCRRRKKYMNLLLVISLKGKDRCPSKGQIPGVWAKRFTYWFITEAWSKQSVCLGHRKWQWGSGQKIILLKIGNKKWELKLTRYTDYLMKDRDEWMYNCACIIMHRAKPPVEFRNNLHPHILDDGDIPVWWQWQEERLGVGGLKNESSSMTFITTPPEKTTPFVSVLAHLN